MKVWWLYDLDDYVYQSLTPFSYFYLSQPQPSVPRSYNVILYFFMQSGQRLRPNAISVLQKAHATLAPSISVRGDVSNKNDWGRMAFKSCWNPAIRFFSACLEIYPRVTFLVAEKEPLPVKEKKG
jgi:hypothetical protein